MTKVLPLVVALLSVGCSTPRWNYRSFFEHHPRSILVVPASNETTAVEAPEVLATTITAPLAERGYYVFPVYLTADLLRDLGLTNESLVTQVSPTRFLDLFGADSVLFVSIQDWSTKYVVLASSVTVKAAYKLVDTRTGLVLWQGEQATVVSSSGGNIIAALVSALLTTTVDYRPVARQTNITVFGASRRGLPAGPYHADFRRDYGKYQD